MRAHARFRRRLLLGLLGAVVLGGCKDALVLPMRKVLAPDGGWLTPQRAENGEACAVHADCESSHCDNETCCASGDCCRDDLDCGESDPVCAQPRTCQGQRRVRACSDEGRCEERELADDDQACTADMEADGCGPYPSVFCNGDQKQTAPVCPDACDDDDGCDEGAHCSPEGSCVADLADAATCNGDGDCVSGHCDHGVCCDSGTCCNSAEDCDAAEFHPNSVCDTKATCQGTREVPACEQHQCKRVKVPDDSACDLSVVANACGGGVAVRCMGGRAQPAPPPCASGTCRQYFDCVRSAFCTGGMCVPDLANGESCTSADMCQSGHCEAEICCSYDCCDTAHRCPSAPCADGGACPS